MELRVLQYFLAVAREQNISAAAQSLNLTQPTLSRQLKELEEELVQKDREMYDLKHELITSQIQFENAEKEMQLIKDQEAELQKENIRLETQLKSHSKR